MKIIFLFFILLSINNTYSSTDWMIRFGGNTAYTGANINLTKYEYDDRKDKEKTDRSLSLNIGRKIHQNLQIIGYLNYDHTKRDDYETSSNDISLGLEYNFSKEFESSYYISILYSSNYIVNDDDDDGKITSTHKYRHFSFGKRIPIIGRKGFITYSPNLLILKKDLNSREDNFINSKTIVYFNFLMFDILF